MPLVLLALYVFALVFFDQYVTVKRVDEYGPYIELNPLVRRAIIRWGAFPGSIMGIILPNLATIVLLSAFWHSGLIFLAGLKTCWALMQMKSLDL